MYKSIIFDLGGVMVDFDPRAYLDSVSGGAVGDVSIQLPEGGLSTGVSRVTYSCVGQNGTVGSTVLYVVTE